MKWKYTVTWMDGQMDVFISDRFLHAGRDSNGELVIEGTEQYFGGTPYRNYVVIPLANVRHYSVEKA